MKPTLILGIILGVIVLFLVWGSYFVIEPGNVGVTFNKLTGKTNVSEQGIHGKLPIITDVYEYDVRTQKDSLASESSSKDLQKVSIQADINYHLNYENVNRIHTKIGPDYANRVIHPTVYECVKAASAKFNVEEIITKRETLKTDIENTLKEKLTQYDILVENVNLVEIKFDPKFDSAVEDKQIESQRVQASEFIRQRAMKEKEASILQAQGEAEKQKLLAKSTSKDVIALKWIEKWNGQLPQYMFGKDSNMMLMQK
jgi:regulator of protease activity HflC (stomatin/prohibitin superfamily)